MTNLRCDDIPYTPLFFGYAFVNLGAKEDESIITLCVDNNKCDKKVIEYLRTEKITLSSIDGFFAAIDDWYSLFGNNPGYIDYNSAAYDVVCKGKELSVLDDSHINIISLAKYIKPWYIVDNLSTAMLEDCIAHVNFYAWLEANKDKNSEKDLEEKLLEFKRHQIRYLYESFPTVSASGPNSSLPHHESDGNSTFNREKIYLLNSGSHFLDGTTAIARTFHFGTPTAEEIDIYTRVLLGCLSVETMKMDMTAKLSGSRVDMLARQYLGLIGLSYEGGSGHGVGSYLSVVEKPIEISSDNTVPFQEGYVVVLEPGYFKDGEFGIRLENVLKVVEEKVKDVSTGFYIFENLTLLPYERRLINIDLLSTSQITSIDTYHTKVYEALKDKVDEDALNWLENNTRPIGK